MRWGNKGERLDERVLPYGLTQFALVLAISEPERHRQASQCRRVRGASWLRVSVGVNGNTVLWLGSNEYVKSASPMQISKSNNLKTSILCKEFASPAQKSYSNFFDHNSQIISRVLSTAKHYCTECHSS